MREQELRASIAAIGPILPALYYRDQLLDGAKRVAICEELELHCPQRRVRSLREACSALWVLHPARALELAGDQPLLELAKLCGTSAAAIATFRARHREPAPTKRTKIRNDRRLHSVKLQVWIEPQLLEYADRAGEVLKLNRAGVVRRAIWKLCALTVPRAPLHPPRHVSERERRPSHQRRRSRDSDQ